MKILIVFFSGTGNTFYCANYLKERLKHAGTEIRLGSVEHLPKRKIADYDVLVVGFPVYACDVPKIVTDYLEGAPTTSLKRAYLFCTKGFYSGNALKNAAGILSASGYRVLGGADVAMPGSDGMAFLKEDSPAAKKMCGRDFSRIESLDRLAETIRSDSKDEKPDAKQRRLSSNAFGPAATGLFRLAFTPAERWLAGRLRADENCVRCGYCEKICPAGNIRVTDGGVRFGGTCFLCMRCVHQCPKAVVQIGKGTVGKMRWKGPDGRFRPLLQDGSGGDFH
jgi:ferredoxin